MKVIVNHPAQDIPESMRRDLAKVGPISWFGINSFEERCTGSLTRLGETDLNIQSVYFLEYPTSARPESEDRRLRRVHREYVADLASRSSAALTSYSVEAYASDGLISALTKFIDAHPASALVLDISCFTKIHVVAAAECIRAMGPTRRPIFAVYTSPRAYGNLDQTSKVIGWSDVIVAPISNSAQMRNESHSRGIIIAGHESERLWSALNEIEPAAGLVALGNTPGRPDITRLSERVNKKIMSHIALDYDSAWHRKVVDIADVEEMRLRVSLEVALAKPHSSPVILYPFGPKTLILASALALLDLYPEASWFVYPVPAGYDVSYSEGIGGTYWFLID